MALADFVLLINLVRPKIVKMDNRFLAAVQVQERLVVTLWVLATDDLYTNLQCLFEISNQSVKLYLKRVKLMLRH